MAKDEAKNFIHFLPADLWGPNVNLIRSEELTPLWIDRYNGPRQNTQMKAHDFWELTHIFKGSGVLKTRTSTEYLQPRKSCLIPPNMNHCELSNGTMDTLWIGLKGKILRRLDMSKVFSVSDARLDECFGQLWMRAEHPYGLIGPELDGLTRTALGLLFRLLTEKSMPNHNYVDAAIKYINHHFAEIISVTWLAAKFGYSEGHFYRTFHKRTGKTPMNYITEVRIKNARRWLQYSSLSIEKIAKMVGYRDALYFSRVFRGLTGQSPSLFRKDSITG